MIGRSLIFVFGVCAVAVALVPSADETGTGGAAEETGAVNTLETGDTGGAPSSWYQDDHTLTRESDGHFYANVTVAGAPLRMMVDTGASVIALTAADAQAAGLSWSEADVRVIGRGASGDVRGVPAMLGDVDVGGMTAHNIQAVIIPEGLDISLLGQSYLSSISSVEIAEDRMILSAQ